MTQLPENLRARLAELDARPPLDVVRDFLAFSLGDADSLDEVRADLRQTAQVSTRAIERELAAFEDVLSAPRLPRGVPARLVAWDGNWVLDDPSDAGAVLFLRELAQLIREVLLEAGQRPA